MRECTIIAPHPPILGEIGRSARLGFPGIGGGTGFLVHLLRSLRKSALRNLSALMLGIALVCGRAAGQGALTQTFPQTAEVRDWTLKESPKVYSGSQIFDFMDGAGEIPKSYHFQQVASAKYQKGGVLLSVSIFDMGQPSDAFGYYSARSFLEQNPKAKERIITLDHPAHLYASAGVLTFWKDRYTVILEPDNGKPEEADLLKFARLISSKIPAKGSPPDLLRRLPAANRVANSERFLRGKPVFDATLVFMAKDVFGTAGGAEAVAAEYNLPGGIATLCIIRYPNGKASDAFNSYRQYLTSRQAVFAASSVPNGFIALAKKEKGTGAVWSGNMLGLVIGAKDIKTAESVLRTLLAAMKAK